jgi:hypothetical protein
VVVGFVILGDRVLAVGRGRAGHGSRTAGGSTRSGRAHWHRGAAGRPPSPRD